MAVTLNETAFEFARGRVTEGKFVADERDAWSEHQPSAQQGNEFIDIERAAVHLHGMIDAARTVSGAYGR